MPGTTSGQIHSMDPSLTNYNYIQIQNGAISTFTPPSKLPSYTIQLPATAAVYPGFIDSHSHAMSFAIPNMLDTKGNPFWINLANVNVMLQPACPSGTTSTPTCFAPVKSQALVNSLLSGSPNAINWVLGWNYEPARLGCTMNGAPAYGFQCPNFENASSQTALQQLNALQGTTPLLVTSESGHIVYVNSSALSQLNICPPTGSQPSGCYPPTVNPTEEYALAQTGQLDEDLAIYALTYVVGLMDRQQSALYTNLICTATQAYSQLGYTTVQEGAATSSVIGLYELAAKPGNLPVRMAVLDYIESPLTSKGFATGVQEASVLRTSMKNLDMFIAGIKVFADGSNQGYTGAMTSPVSYTNVNAPFNESSIFPTQPYEGLPDQTALGLTDAIQAAHKSNFPLWVHSNGNLAQSDVLAAMTANKNSNLRDVILHFTTPTQQQVQTAAANNIGVTFLMNDFYYYYQPLCEQVIGPTVQTGNLYPAAWAATASLPFGLHSDTSVTPPSPLFSMWVATTRSVQSPSWITPLQSACAAQQSDQIITMTQALQAYTSNAAWLYNRDTTRNNIPGIGSLQIGYAGDAVVLSADPMNPSTNLSTVQVLYTVHNGNIVYSDPTGQNPVIWPN